MIDRFTNKEYKDVYIFALYQTSYHFSKKGDIENTDKYKKELSLFQNIKAQKI